MAEFIVQATQIDFLSNCPPILKLEGRSLEECAIEGNCVSFVERESAIFMSSKQLGLSDLNGDLSFKVTVERIE